MEFGPLIVILGIALAIYFVPWIVAANRGHPSIFPIAILNIFAGWTFVGWVIALVWACTGKAASEREADNIIMNPNPVQTHRKCPYCAEEILAAAIKCKHCGSAVVSA